MPISANRHYGFDNTGQTFTDAWNNSKCNPASLTPGGNDIMASVTNLFAGHNRMHDFSYFLGFTEGNYNLQKSNFGNDAQGGTVPGGGANDPEIGNVQAGALSGGSPTYEGRDNANQIALQDGIPGITNQYLFQPIAAAFYSPCADGDFDAPVYGHEYTHAISNRMVGGPDDGLTGLQAGAMGESWSDQVALEYLFEHGYSNGTSNPWVEGPYVTGNKATGIRNYALNANPLQYGDIGYDVTGPEVHADGEVWSAAMFNVRRQLVSKYNGSYPESNKSLQLRCADGQSATSSPLPPQQCPGGRRWIQLMFDAFLLQEGTTSMLDARDAMLAADKTRFAGANQAAMWKGFAQNGMGAGASTTSTDDDQPKSDYTSPHASEGTVTFKTPVKGKIYVGRYEARATPIADTDSATSLPSSIKMVPGTYDFVFQAAGYGLTRLSGDGHGRADPDEDAVAGQEPRVEDQRRDGRRVERQRSQPGQPHRRHGEHQLGRRERHGCLRRLDPPVRERGPRRRQADRQVGPRQRAAAAGGRRRQRRRLRSAVHRPAAVRHRGLQRLRNSRLLVHGNVHFDRVAVQADLHEPSKRVRRGPPAAARPDAAGEVVRRPGHLGHPRAARGAREPVHRSGAVRR